MKKNGTLKSIFKIISNVISWTAFCLLIIIGGFLLYYVICAKVYAAKGEKYEPKFSLYTIISPSMEGTLNVYDVILDVRVDDPNKVEVGDIITFTSTSSISNGMVVTHRVVGKEVTDEGVFFTTKGDNNLVADSSPALGTNVTGKVILRIPQLGRVQFFIASKGGWIIFILLPALGIVIYDILKLSKLMVLKQKTKNEELNKPETKEDKNKKKK